MGYQQDRDQFIAAATREGLPLCAIETLLRCATTIQRLAELACSSEAADRDRIPCPAGRKTKPGPCLCDGQNGAHVSIPRITMQDHQAEARAAAALPLGWSLQTTGDPRGYTLRVIPPSYADRNRGRDRFNREAIGVPARDSRLRF